MYLQSYQRLKSEAVNDTEPEERREEIIRFLDENSELNKTMIAFGLDEYAAIFGPDGVTALYTAIQVHDANLADLRSDIIHDFFGRNQRFMEPRTLDLFRLVV